MNSYKAMYYKPQSSRGPCRSSDIMRGLKNLYRKKRNYQHYFLHCSMHAISCLQRPLKIQVLFLYLGLYLKFLLKWSIFDHSIKVTGSSLFHFFVTLFSCGIGIPGIMVVHPAVEILT